MNETEKPKRVNKPIERVTVCDTLKEKLCKLVEQANAAMQGMADISKSDIVNLLLDEHGDVLTAAQIKKLKATHIDQVKYAYWIAEKLKLARDSGQVLSIQDLISKSQSAFDKPRKQRKTKTRNKHDPSAASPDHNTQDSKPT